MVWMLDPSFDRIFDNIFSGVTSSFLDRYCYKDKYTGKYILCVDNARFINHSESFNNIDPIPHGDFAYGADIANKDIKSGDEIFINYNLIHDGVWS